MMSNADHLGRWISALTSGRRVRREDQERHAALGATVEELRERRQKQAEALRRIAADLERDAQ